MSLKKIVVYKAPTSEVEKFFKVEDVFTDADVYEAVNNNSPNFNGPYTDDIEGLVKLSDDVFRACNGEGVVFHTLNPMLVDAFEVYREDGALDVEKCKNVFWVYAGKGQFVPLLSSSAFMKKLSTMSVGSAVADSSVDAILDDIVRSVIASAA